MALPVGDEDPITGMCIVSQTCPFGYLLIDKCFDNPKAEADLWRDQSLFGKKSKRFLCFTRIYPLEGGRLNNVLVSLSLIDEKDAIPVGYSVLSNTQDTGEPSLRRKLLCAKLIPRSQSTDAINDIQLLIKNKRPSIGYTQVGEIYGLLLCYRVGKVPPSSVFVPSSARVVESVPYPITPVVQIQVQPHSVPHDSTLPAHRQNSRIEPLTGVPFEINSRLIINVTNQLDGPDITLKSRDEIMTQFDYPFTVELAAQQMVSTYRNGYM